MTSKKEHYIRRRIEIAKKAIDIYSQGILTPLEVNCGCSAEELTKTWKETLKIEEDTLLQQLETTKPKPYTLDQAYQVILLEKQKMGIDEYQEKQLRQQYNRGYHDGLERCRKVLSRIVEITEIP